MKKLMIPQFSLKHLVILLLLISNSTFAQRVVFDSLVRQSEILDILSISEDEYVFASKSDFVAGTKIEWYKADSVFKKHILSQDISGLEFQQTEDGILVEASSFLECDVAIPFFHSFLLDTIESEESYFPSEAIIDDYFANIMRTNEGDLILLTGDAIGDVGEVLKVFRDNESLLEFKLPNENITKIVEGQDRVYVFGEEYLLYFNKNGLVVDTVFFEGENVVDVTETVDSNQVAILTDTKVLTVNFLSGIERSYPLSNLAAVPIDLLYRDQLFLLVTLPDSGTEVQKLDLDGNWQTYYNIAFNQSDYTEMYPMPNDEIWITGHYFRDFASNTGGIDYRYKGAYVIEKTLQTEDAENNISLDFIGYESLSDDEVKIDLRLTNHSNSLLKDIRVFSNNLSQVWCSGRYFDTRVDSIAAGETLEISDTIKLFFNLSEDDYCFYVLGSGEDVDIDFSDNVTCAILVNTQVELERRNELNFYPNPAVDKLVIENRSTNNKYFILNLHGQLIKVVRTGRSNTIQVGDLAPGIYLLKDSNAGIALKFVKI
jgi:hypothetical protein